MADITTKTAGAPGSASGNTISGNTRVTREDWLRSGRAVLVEAGVGSVKIMTLGRRLGVSRSSFYWYFGSREDLLAQLLAEWERGNTRALIAHAERPADTITQAVCNVFLCVVAPGGFDHRLDFAVREWARRDAEVRAELDRSDAARTEALAAMFRRHGYAPAEAEIRARVLYYQQIGYYALELNETMEVRLFRVAGYLHAFTGVAAPEAEVTAFTAEVRRLCEA